MQRNLQDKLNISSMPKAVHGKQGWRRHSHLPLQRFGRWFQVDNGADRWGWLERYISEERAGSAGQGCLGVREGGFQAGTDFGEKSGRQQTGTDCTLSEKHHLAQVQNRLPGVFTKGLKSIFKTICPTKRNFCWQSRNTSFLVHRFAA